MEQEPALLNSAETKSDAIFMTSLPSCSHIMDRLAAALGGFETADGGDASAAGSLPSLNSGASSSDGDPTPGEQWRGVRFVRIDGSVDSYGRQAAVGC